MWLLSLPGQSETMFIHEYGEFVCKHWLPLRLNGSVFKMYQARNSAWECSLVPGGKCDGRFMKNRENHG